MKRLSAVAILLVTSIAASALLRAQINIIATPVAVASAEKSPVAGQYSGKWKSTNDESGDLRMKLQQDAAGVWSAEVTFTAEEKPVVTTMKSVQVEGMKIRLMFEWPVDGGTGRCQVTGELTGDTLKGTYETSGAGDPSRGTWSVKRS
jgi:hypothetical protein